MLVRPRFLLWLTLLFVVLSACQKDPTPPAPPRVPSYMVSTLAGALLPGTADGVGSAAQFDNPAGIAIDAQGVLYVVDSYTHRVRMVTPAGVVRTLAGGSLGDWAGGGLVDGVGTDARFNFPHGVAVDAQGNVYVADTFNHRIRRITPAGVVTTLAGSGPREVFGEQTNGGYADGPASTARFFAPFGVAVDGQGTVYVADYGNDRIRKISPAGVVSTLAGSGVHGSADGSGNEAQFMGPHSITLDAQGTLYVTDALGSRIRKVTLAGVVSTVAGTGEEGYVDGAGNKAQFDYPNGIAVDARGWLYVADAGNKRIRRITPAGVVTTLAGTGEGGTANGHDYEAQFHGPEGLVLASDGTLYVTASNQVRVLTPRP